MNKENNNEESHHGLKKLGIGFVARNHPFGIAEAKWEVMKSILITLVVSDAITLEVKESDGETVVTGYMFVKSDLQELPTTNRINHAAISDAVLKYPFLKDLLLTQYH